MIDWSTIRPVMIELFGKLSGLQTVWIDQRSPYIDPKKQAILKLRVRSSEEIGIADRRYTDLALPPPQATLEESSNSMNRVGFDVRVESLRHEDDRFAFNAISRVRSRLFFASNLAVLRAVNVAIVRAGQAIDLPDLAIDDRIVSTAQLDLQTTIASCAVNSGTENQVFNIETVDNPFDHPNTQFNPPC